MSTTADLITAIKRELKSAHMTYAAFLAIFIAIPLVVLLTLLIRGRRSGARLPDHLTAFPPFAVLAAHVVVAAYEAEAQLAATRGGDRRHFARAREVRSHPSVAVFGSRAADRQTQSDGDRREEPES